MAKIDLNIIFDNKDWKPIKISTETSDKNAYRIYRLIIPKPADFKVIDEDEARAAREEEIIEKEQKH